MAVYGNTRLDSSEHAWLCNESAPEFGLPEQSEATQPKDSPILRLDPANESLLAAAFDMPAVFESTTEVATVDGREVLRFRGNASAGVDLDANDRARGDRVECEFRFRVEESGRHVLATIGDANHPVRVVVEQGEVSLCSAEEAQPLGTVSADGWATLRLDSGGSSTTAQLGKEKPATTEHHPTATWLYLGEGYPNRGTPVESSVVVDVGSVRSRVTTDSRF